MNVSRVERFVASVLLLRNHTCIFVMCGCGCGSGGCVGGCGNGGCGDNDNNEMTLLIIFSSITRER